MTRLCENHNLEGAGMSFDGNQHLRLSRVSRETAKPPLLVLDELL